MPAAANHPRILVFGSLNIDHVYQVPHFVRPGETLASAAYQKHAGGKGLNQAIALARAGMQVSFAGAVGQDGVWLRDMLAENGVDPQHIRVIEEATGHAIIQVDQDGNNAIVLFGGANQCIGSGMIGDVLAGFSAGDCVLLQNEISGCPQIIRTAADRGIRVALNPSPASPALREWPLELVDFLILNEVEGYDLTGFTAPDDIVRALRDRCPSCAIVLTLGEQGAVYAAADTGILRQPAYPVQAVDTTAAGDTFTGYFLQAVLSGDAPAAAMQKAACAASITVSRPGAGQSIPTQEETQARLNQQTQR